MKTNFEKGEKEETISGVLSQQEQELVESFLWVKLENNMEEMNTVIQ